MIDSTSFNSAHALSEKLAATKSGLVVIPNSVLAACIEASKTPMAFDYGNDNWEQAWNESLACMPIWGTRDNVTLADEDGGSTVVIPTALHESTMAEATGVASRAVTTALAAARNLHKPIISDFIERVTRQVEISNQIVEPVEIIDVHLNPAWDEPVVQALLRKYGKGQRRYIVQRNDVPRMTAPDDIDELMRTGSTQLDKSYAELLRESGLTNKKVFDSVFNSDGNFGGHIPQMWMKRNQILAQVIMISILADNPPAGTGISKSKWENVCRELLLALGYECYVHLVEEETIRETKRLVADADVVSGKIYLHGAVYDKWLDEGGVPEIIYGAFLGTGSIANIKYDKLLTDKEVFLANWRRFHASKAARDEQELVTKVKTAMMIAISDVAKTINPELIPAGQTVNGSVERGEKVVKALDGSWWTRDIGLSCLTVACDVFFHHTPTKRLLTRINDLITNQSMDAEEAAAVATIEYMNDWLSGQLRLKSEGGVDESVLYHQNMIVLTNLAELSSRALLASVGGDASKTIEGEKIGRQLLTDTAVARVGGYVAPFITK